MYMPRSEYKYEIVKELYDKKIFDISTSLRHEATKANLFKFTGLENKGHFYKCLRDLEKSGVITVDRSKGYRHYVFLTPKAVKILDCLTKYEDEAKAIMRLIVPIHLERK